MLLLHDVFDYPFAEIAAIVGKSEDNARQLAARARQHVEQRRPPLSDHPRAARGSWQHEVGIDVVVAHEGDHVVDRALVPRFLRLVTGHELVVVAEPDDPGPRGRFGVRALDFVRVSVSGMVIMFWLIVVFALAGPDRYTRT